ncbi:MAG: hypothetical protein ACP5UZ_07590 [Thermoplasmata archaeon]
MRKDRATNEALILVAIAEGINTWAEIAKEVEMNKRPVHTILHSLEERGLIKGIRSGFLRGELYRRKVIYELPAEDPVKFASTSSKIFDLMKYSKMELTKKLKEYMKTDAYLEGCHKLSMLLQEKLGPTPSKFIWQEVVDTEVPKEIEDKTRKAYFEIVKVRNKPTSFQKSAQNNEKIEEAKDQGFSSEKEELLRSRMEFVESMIEKLELNMYSLTLERYLELRETIVVLKALTDLFNEKIRNNDSNEGELSKLKETLEGFDRRLAELSYPFLIPFSLYISIEDKIKEKTKYSEYLDQILLSFPDSAKWVLNLVADLGGIDIPFDHAEIKMKLEGKEKSGIIVHDIARFILASAIMKIDNTNVIIPESFLLKYFDLPIFALMAVQMRSPNNH